MLVKTCNKCKETKPLLDFSKKSKDIEDKKVEHICKKCKKEEYKKWYTEKSKDLEYIEKRKLKRREYYYRNKERMREKQKEYYEKTYGIRKHMYRAAWSRYKAKKLESIPSFLKDCNTEKKRIDDIYLLSRLMSKATGVEHHVDHMWPLSRGGPHWSGNLQIIKAEENYKKNASVDKNIKHTIKQMLMELEKANATGE